MERQRLLLVLLAGLVLLTSWWSYELDEGEVRPRTPGAVDYRIESFERLSLDAQGQPSERLRAPLLVHYGDGGGAELLQPEITLYSTDGFPWELQSERAWVDDQQDVILMYGAVLGWRLDATGARRVELTTRDLRILRSAQYAESAEPTWLRDGLTESEGIGMRADLARDRVELLAKVRTRHQTQAP